MKGKELSSFLRKCFSQRLSSLKVKKSGSQFTYIEDDYTYSILFTSRNYGDLFPTSFACWGGFLSVDKIMLLASDSKEGTKQIIHGSQIFIRQVQFFNQGTYPCSEYNLYTLEEAEKACNEITDYFLNTVIPTMRNYNTLEKMFLYLNDDEFIKKDKFPERSIRYSLIIAKLLKYDNYEQLKKEYRTRLSGSNDLIKNRFENTVSFLDTHSYEELVKMSS